MAGEGVAQPASILERSKSSLSRFGQQKNKNSVHYPDSTPPHIDPPSISAATIRSIATCSLAHAYAGGSAGARGRSLSLTREGTPYSDIENQSDASTPADDGIDLTDLFGPYTGRGKHKQESPFAKGGYSRKKKDKARGQGLTIVALRLALIEKAASGLGTLAFLWATVVILGGFASTVRLTDFWVVTAIILAEGSRIYSRSRWLEWQQLTSTSGAAGLPSRILHASLNAVGSLHNPDRGKRRLGSALKERPGGKRPPLSRQAANNDMKLPISSSSSTSTRHNARKVVANDSLNSANAIVAEPQTKGSSPSPRVIPFLFTTEVVSQILYVAQVLSASVCIGLSIWRLSNQKFYEPPTDDNVICHNADCNTQATTHKLPNVTVSMNVFYVLSVVEAGLFLLERGYWEYRLRHGKLYKQALLDAVLEDSVTNVVVVKQFFYDTYEQCLKGSVFDGLSMDLVEYSISWLESKDDTRQLAGARLLNQFVSSGHKLLQNDPVAMQALRDVGTTPGIIERLVEMLSWNSDLEEDLLLSEVSAIICRLVVYDRNCSRFVAVPGAVDGVVSLLLAHLDEGDHVVPLMKLTGSPYHLRLTGLKILKYLCKDQKYTLKIGETRSLLSSLILFIKVKGESSFREDMELKGRLKIYKKSLQVLRTLAAVTNTAGKTLRERIATYVSGLKNLRDVIEYGEERPELQLLAIEILFHLAMEDEVRKMIGATGGVIRSLFNLFKAYGSLQESKSGPVLPKREEKLEQEIGVAVRAGEALTRLVLQNGRNCVRLIELKNSKDQKPLVAVMVHSLDSRTEKVASSAASILRSVLLYADEETRAEIAKLSAATTVDRITKLWGVVEQQETYEASLGLASRALPELDIEEYAAILRELDKVGFVHQLMRNLRHTPTTNRHPRIRRYSVELILGLIAKDDSFLDAFQRHHDLKSELEKSLDSITEVENFCLFSGWVGYTRHSVDMETLVESAIQAVDEYQNRSNSSHTTG